jgi:glycosyltransferase involved in cell wall biosynthesis
MARVLYISYWGGLEPLGQSLILPALYKLSEMGAEVTFISFDKPHDLDNKSEYERVMKEMQHYEIDWLPLRYHKTPRIPATLFDITNGVVRGIIERLKKRPDIIHARCYVGGLIGMSLAKILRAKWVYHNEGFYSDEQVDGNFWALNSRQHRIAKALELKMYADADGVIALSHRAKKIIAAMPKVEKKKTPIIVVPSCVDLEKFSLRNETPKFKDKLNLVYVGTIGGRYILTKVGKFANVALKEMGMDNFHLRILSRAPYEDANAMLEPSGLPSNAWSIQSVPYTEMTRHLAPHHAGLFFLAQGISEHGCSPTKIGEYWATGLPVVTTPNVSDTDDIIHKENVGIIVQKHTEEAYKKAFSELKELLKDPNISERCRRAAETYYALAPACERQIALYETVKGNKR